MSDKNSQKTALEDVLSGARKVEGAARLGKAIANIAKGAASGGLHGAAAGAVKSFGKQFIIIAVVLLLLPVLFILLLPTLIFGGLNAPDQNGLPIMNNNPQIVEYISETNSTVAGILMDGYTETKEDVEAQASRIEYVEIVDTVGGNIVFDANKIICWYSASQNETAENISIPHLASMVEAHKRKLYYYTIDYEDRTITWEDDDGNTHEETVTYTIFTILYAGEEYFPNELFALSAEQLSLSTDYSSNLTIFLYDSFEATANGTHDEIKDLLGDDDTPLADGEFGSPFPGTDWAAHITSPFGSRPYPGVGSGTTNHTGLDIGMAEGTTIHAVNSGTVLFVRNSGASGYGLHLAINHGGGYVTLYAHCSKILVSEGQQVSAGDPIAEVGQTGWSTGPHLHIEVIVDGSPKNPIEYLSK